MGVQQCRPVWRRPCCLLHLVQAGGQAAHSGPDCASVATSTNNSSKSCLPSLASPSPPASPWPPPAACAPPPCRPPSGSPPPPPSLTLTLLPSSLEPALPPSESPGPEPELAPCSAP